MGMSLRVMAMVGVRVSLRVSVRVRLSSPPPGPTWSGRARRAPP